MESETVAAKCGINCGAGRLRCTTDSGSGTTERAAAVIEARFSSGVGPAGGDVAKVVATVESWTPDPRR